MTSMIHRHKTSEEEELRYLDILKKHFTTVFHEKHPTAMLNLIFNDSYDKILGKNYRKQRISKRKTKKLRDEIVDRLRHKYGRWINLTNFKVKSPNDIRFITNFNRVYRIEGQGKLYGSPSELVCSGIFYTSHCLERFEERADPFLYANVIIALMEAYKTEPTSADNLVGLIMTSDYEYGRWKDFLYLNVGVGVLVLDDLGEIFIAKTFLTPDMLHPEMKWYQPLINENDDREITSFQELINKKSTLIDKPTFIHDSLIESMIKDLKDKIKKEDTLKL